MSVEEAAREAGMRCRLCEAAPGGETMVACATCRAVYHADCWEFRRRCELSGCGSTRSLPLGAGGTLPASPAVPAGPSAPETWGGLLARRFRDTIWTVAAGLAGGLLAMLLHPLLVHVRIPAWILLLAGGGFGLVAPWIAGWLHDRPGRSACVAAGVGSLWIPLMFLLATFGRDVLGALGLGWRARQSVLELGLVLSMLLLLFLAQAFLLGATEWWLARWSPEGERLRGSRLVVGFGVTWFAAQLLVSGPLAAFSLAFPRAFRLEDVGTLAVMLTQVVCFAYLPLRLGVERHGTWRRTGWTREDSNLRPAA